MDEFIAFSEFSRLKHREFGFPRDMRVLPGFASVHDVPLATSPKSSHDRPYFLFVGRLERIKGLDDVIPVFAEYPEADLLIAGEGDHSKHLVELAAGAANIKFLGRIPQTTLGDYYRHAIATVVPSVAYETFGAVVIESLAYQTPVIGRDRGGVAETVRQSGGGDLFTNQAELKSLLSRFQHDAQHRSMRAATGHNAYTQRWSEKAVVDTYLDLVREVLNRRTNCARS
ncbi:MAG TPA: glycosyltransferase [Gemmatimonadaceae bacterium]|nr:glycosyltransferase [Gemmatimonadaceae bacterium]